MRIKNRKEIKNQILAALFIALFCPLSNANDRNAARTEYYSQQYFVKNIVKYDFNGALVHDFDVSQILSKEPNNGYAQIKYSGWIFDFTQREYLSDQTMHPELLSACYKLKLGVGYPP